MVEKIKTLALTCSNCGASLDVPEGVRYVTCHYCGSRLQIQRSGNTVYTEILDDIDQRTARIAEDVDAIRLQNELEQLDREWMMEREQYMVRDKHGRTHIPSEGGSALMGVIVVVFGIFWTLMAFNMGAPAFFPLFGLIFIGFGIYQTVTNMGKASAYEEAERVYRRKRRQILDRMQAQRQSDNETTGG